MTDGDVDDEIETEGVCVMVTGVPVGGVEVTIGGVEVIVGGVEVAVGGVEVVVGGVEVAVDVVVDTEEIHCAFRNFVIINCTYKFNTS